MIRLMDLSISGCAILFLWPIMIAVVVLSGVFIGLPPIFVSERRGLNGTVFRHIKIRSMLAGPQRGRVFFELDRINWFGRFLRSSHLDETPDLLHILAGQMSLVGPRPLLLKALEPVDGSVRQTVKPGWTGPAQLWLLRRGLLSKELQIRLDNHYVRRRSPMYNCRILAATVRYFFFGARLNLSPSATPDRITYQNNGFEYLPKNQS